MELRRRADDTDHRIAGLARQQGVQRSTVNTVPGPGHGQIDQRAATNRQIEILEPLMHRLRGRNNVEPDRTQTVDHRRGAATGGRHDTNPASRRRLVSHQQWWCLEQPLTGFDTDNAVRPKECIDGLVLAGEGTECDSATACPALERPSL